MPILQSDTLIYTYEDVVEQLLDLHAGERTPLTERNAKRAVQQAYRDLPNKHNWSFYYRQRLMQTVASYSTGTIAYQHTGGANERQITLTGGTLPAWAAFGRLVIGSVHYEVAERISGTVLTLREDSNPGEDVAALTEYTLYRNAYPLPANFRRLGHLWDVEVRRFIPVVEQQVQHDALVAFFTTPDTPWQAAFRGVSDYYGTMQLLFGPPPSEVFTYDLLYEIHPRPLRIESYSTGTITISGTTVTLTNGVWPANCAGSILRVAATTEAPTNRLGENPFLTEHVIKSRTSDTVVVLEESATDVTGRGFTLSDPIDIEAGAMLNAFLRAAEAEFCRAASRKDANERMALAQQALLEAIGADDRTPPNQSMPVYDPIKHGRIVDGG